MVRRSFPRVMRMVVLFVSFTLVVLGYPAKHLKLADLALSSDVIAVVNVTEPRSAGTAAVNVDGRTVKAVAYRADAHVNRLLKGACPDQFAIDFSVPMEFMGIRGVDAGTQLVFLREVGGRFEFTDPHFPAFPAVAGSESVTNSSDLAEKVLDEMGAVIASPQASQNDKLRILQVAYALPNRPSFRSALRTGLEATGDSDLRYRLEAHLLMRGDLTDLPSLTTSLLRNTLSEHERDMLLSVIATKLEASDAVPSVKRLLQSSDSQLRRSAAQAMWHIADASSQAALIAALDDPDREVRFYAVRALADITGQKQWGPASDLFERDEPTYLKHWRDWADAAQKSNSPH